jgi:hypothetical protein
MSGMRGLLAAGNGLNGTRSCPVRAVACKTAANVAEFPAGIGHNEGFRSVTPADSLQELQARRMDKSSSTIDLDPDDAAEGLELPGADLSNEEISVRVIPRQADEFTCSRCFLVHHRSQIAEDRNGQLVCRECAA